MESKLKEPILVGVCGRSCSGKGAFTKALASVNREVLVLQADCYFQNYSYCSYNGYQCWEHTNCVSFDRLIENLNSLNQHKDTVIHIDNPFMPKIDVKITQKDMNTKMLIIVDGYLIFAIKELVNLFKHKIFINASDYTIQYRRQRRDGVGQINYIHDVIIPVSKEYEQVQKDQADLVVDGDKPKDEVIKTAGHFLNERLLLGNTGLQLGLPPKESPWEVRPGDLLMDTTWHPIDFKNYKEWVQKEKQRLDKGEELKGNTFRYRRNPHSSTYEVRLSSQFRPGIFRYTYEPTSSW